MPPLATNDSTGNRLAKHLVFPDVSKPPDADGVGTRCARDLVVLTSPMSASAIARECALLDDFLPHKEGRLWIVVVAFAPLVSPSLIERYGGL